MTKICLLSILLFLTACGVSRKSPWHSDKYKPYYTSSSPADNTYDDASNTGISIYNRGCSCPPPMEMKDGRPVVPENHPRANYLNDTTYWEWKNVSDEHPEYGKVYDLKPQYLDSMRTYDGEWVKVSKWMAEEEREKDKTYTDSIFVKNSWMRVPSNVYDDWKRRQEGRPTQLEELLKDMLTTFDFPEEPVDTLNKLAL